MLRALACTCFATLFSGAVLAQPSAPPRFLTSIVRTSPASPLPDLRGGFYPGGRYELHQATMVDLVSIAWGVDADRVMGGPAWVAKDHFDVIGTAPPDTSQDALKTMLQELLKDRFKLVVRQETKPMPSFVLSLGKGKPKMKEAADSGEPGCRPQPRTTAPAQGEVPQIHYSCRNVTMDMFVSEVHDYANGYLTSPAINGTNLSGSWDFDLTWTGRGNLTAAGSEGVTLFDAIDKQLGMKMEPKETPMAVVSIESVNQKPTDNPPGISDKEAPAPTEFDVADIKPSDPKATGAGISIQNGRVTVRNITVKTLMSLAWQINTTEITGGPKSIDSNHWDIVAKAPVPAIVADTKPIGLEADYASILIMLQSLLKDRFKLQVHNEDRQVAGYALLADKPKLKKASDPSARPDCNEGPGPDGKDPRIANPDASRLVTCLNMTVAEFAGQLRNRAGGYLGQYPAVVDASGIEGRYDFTINFSVAGMVNGNAAAAAAAGGGGAAGGANAADPTRVISLFDALEKQLGLKLESRKVTSSMLVIDHVEDTPTEN